MADRDSNTALVLALVGAGAALAWWLWRGRRGDKGHGGAGDQAPRSADGLYSAPVVVRIGSSDRITVDGMDMDLATAVERARRAAHVDVYVAGDARHAWVTKVKDALRATARDIDWHDLTPLTEVLRVGTKAAPPGSFGATPDNHRW